MVKYRLIKKYPGSPELGTIAEKAGDIKYTYPDGRESFTSSSAECLFEKLIENQPEFWEKIVEKDYEILSVISNNFPKDIFYRNEQNFDEYIREDNFQYVYTLGYILENLNKHIRIHSIKRKSDGEIFTVGDNLENGCINKFFLEHNNITFTTVLDSTKRGLYQAKKIKKPLFTTEDGVDIFDPRQKVFSVSECDFILQDHQDYSWIITRDSERKYHHFSTKEAAEEYILMNKPCLSIADICEYFDGQLSECSNLFYLKKLAKSKLNENKV